MSEERDDTTTPAPAAFLEQLAELRAGMSAEERRRRELARVREHVAPKKPHPLAPFVERERARTVDPSPALARTPQRKDGAPQPSRSVRAPASVRRRPMPRAARRKFLEELARRGAPECRPRDIPRRVQAGVRAIFENRSGREAYRALERMPRAWRAPLLELARRPRSGRELGAGLRHVWSRWVVSVAWLVWALRRASKRNGFRWVVDGYTQPMLGALFTNPATGLPYSRSRLFATSYRVGSDECGPFEAVKRLGLVHFAQPRCSDASPRFIGPPRIVGHTPSGEPITRRFAFAIYWLHAAPPTAPPQ